jgi:hypothetical protein
VRGALVSLSLAASIILLMSGCGTSAGLDNGPESGPGGSPTFDDFEDLDGNWELLTATDANGQFDLSVLASHGGADEVVLTLTLTAGKLAGTAACNSYFGEFVGVPGALRVEGVGSTLMYCEDSARMDLESRYLAALSSVTSAQLGSGVGLILLGDGVGLSFLPVIDTLGG